MKILALELSSGQGSIAWCDGDEIRFHAEFANDRKHSGSFFANLQRGMEQIGKPERIAVGLGPGSYAGTRIAIAAAIGLQAAMAAELIGLPSLCALATDELEYLACGDARRESFWLARVRARSCVEGPALCSAEELSERIGATRLPVFSSESVAAFPQATLLYPSAVVIARIAGTSADDFRKAPLEPIYLREAFITRPKIR